MAPDDEFDELVRVRMSADADAQVGQVAAPLAEIRRAGRQRSRRRRGLQVAAVVAVVVGCASLSVRWGGPTGETAAPTVAVASSPPASPSPSPSARPHSVFFCPGSTQTEPPANPGPSGPPNDPDVQHAADVASELGRGEYRDHFSGVCTESSTRTLFVYRVPGSGFDSALTERAGTPGLNLRFIDAKYTKAQLSPVAQRIIEDPYWKSKGVLIASVSPLADGSGVEVGTPQAQTARAEILARYGPMVSAVIQQEPAIAL